MRKLFTQESQRLSITLSQLNYSIPIWVQCEAKWSDREEYGEGEGYIQCYITLKMLSNANMLCKVYYS